MAAPVPLFDHGPEVKTAGWDEARGEDDGNGDDSEAISCEMCGVSNCAGREFWFDDVIPEDEFKEDKIEGRYFHGSDEEEPVEDCNKGLGEEDEVCACYGGDGTACTEDGILIEEDMAETREDGPGEIKQDVVDVAELAVNGISEEIEEVHVAEDVHDASMEKGVCEELPDVRGFGV
jgi:hypothetical protein